MKRLGVAATQDKRAEIFWIKRLPADGNFRLLRIVLAMRRRLKWKGSRRWNCRCVLAVSLFPLSKVHLEAVEPREVPHWAGEGHAHFLVN